MVAEFFSKKIFIISFSATLLYSLTCFLPPEESTRSIECCTFNGTKSNYLFDQIDKWFVLKDLRVLSGDKGGASDFLAFSNFNHTLDKGPITERALFCIFPRISSIAKELFLFFSFNRSFKNLKIRPFS